MTKYKFIIYRDEIGEWRFRLKAPNGRIIAVGEGYRSRANCIKTVKSIKMNAADAEIIIER